MKHLKQAIAKIISSFVPSKHKTATYQKIAGYSFSRVSLPITTRALWPRPADRRSHGRRD